MLCFGGAILVVCCTASSILQTKIENKNNKNNKERGEKHNFVTGLSQNHIFFHTYISITRLDKKILKPVMQSDESGLQKHKIKTGKKHTNHE